MSNVLDFPTRKVIAHKKIERAIDSALEAVKPEYKARLKEEALRALKKYDNLFDAVSLELPSNTTEEQIAKLKKLFEEKEGTILKLLAEIVGLQIAVLINQINQEKM